MEFCSLPFNTSSGVESAKEIFLQRMILLREEVEGRKSLHQANLVLWELLRLEKLAERRKPFLPKNLEYAVEQEKTILGLLEKKLIKCGRSVFGCFLLSIFFVMYGIVLSISQKIRISFPSRVISSRLWRVKVVLESSPLPNFLFLKRYFQIFF